MEVRTIAFLFFFMDFVFLHHLPAHRFVVVQEKEMEVQKELVVTYELNAWGSVFKPCQEQSFRSECLIRALRPTTLVLLVHVPKLSYNEGAKQDGRKVTMLLCYDV